MRAGDPGYPYGAEWCCQACDAQDSELESLLRWIRYSADQRQIVALTAVEAAILSRALKERQVPSRRLGNREAWHTGSSRWAELDFPFEGAVHGLIDDALDHEFIARIPNHGLEAILQHLGEPLPAQRSRSAQRKKTPLARKNLTPLLLVEMLDIGKIPMYKIAGPGPGFLACEVCQATCVQVRRVSRIQRDDFRVVDVRTLDIPGPVEEETETINYAPSSGVQGDSLLLEIQCEAGHSWWIEFGRHQGSTPVMVTVPIGNWPSS